MIRYTLNCAKGHDFESWFRDSAAYDAQRARKLVACPACGSTEVEKAIMAPSIRPSERVAAVPAEAGAAVPGPSASGPSAVGPATAQPVALMSEREQALRAMIRAVREHVTSHADYVGEDFATLARQMHEGDVEHRSIYGEASAEEIRALIEDEIEIHPLPALPDERN
ncbi:DUF1178 family protein [Ancylobacter terrae]|uniref:DUF1178 family protein n=1 Tax=Ancylobacter sp. sgz301288 TaxID=3342077 RepID=UPI00385FD0D1